MCSFLFVFLFFKQKTAYELRISDWSSGRVLFRSANGDFHFVVASTSIAPQKVAAGIEMRQVRHSLAELRASKGHLDTLLAQGAKVPKGVFGWRVDSQSNIVVVSIGRRGQQAGIDFVALSGADAQTIRFQVEDEQPSLRSDLKGGLGYLRDPGDGYLYACSIGFNVSQGGTPGYVTAGHCGDTGEPVRSEEHTSELQSQMRISYAVFCL